MPTPDYDALVARHHDAGVDAHITCLIYITVLQAVRAESGSRDGHAGNGPGAVPTIADIANDAVAVSEVVDI